MVTEYISIINKIKKINDDHFCQFCQKNDKEDGWYAVDPPPIAQVQPQQRGRRIANEAIELANELLNNNKKVKAKKKIDNSYVHVLYLEIKKTKFENNMQITTNLVHENCLYQLYNQCIRNNIVNFSFFKRKIENMIKDKSLIITDYVATWLKSQNIEFEEYNNIIKPILILSPNYSNENKGRYYKNIGYNDEEDVEWIRGPRQDDAYFVAAQQPVEAEPVPAVEILPF